MGKYVKKVWVRTRRLDSFEQRKLERRKTSIRKLRRLDDEAAAYGDAQIRPGRRA
jgi:hypothetical protein